jgi:hypothetical protein
MTRCRLTGHLKWLHLKEVVSKTYVTHSNLYRFIQNGYVEIKWKLKLRNCLEIEVNRTIIGILVRSKSDSSHHWSHTQSIYCSIEITVLILEYINAGVNYSIELLCRYARIIIWECVTTRIFPHKRNRVIRIIGKSRGGDFRPPFGVWWDYIFHLTTINISHVLEFFFSLLYYRSIRSVSVIYTYNARMYE